LLAGVFFLKNNLKIYKKIICSKEKNKNKLFYFFFLKKWDGIPLRGLQVCSSSLVYVRHGNGFPGRLSCRINLQIMSIHLS
jgi:hypothetical protein